MKYTLTITEYGKPPETIVTEERRAYMDAVYAAVAKGGTWMRGQTAYLSLAHLYPTMMTADEHVTIEVSCE